MVRPLAHKLAALKPDIVIHSDMIRTRIVATAIARQIGVQCATSPLWRERNFGKWEGQSWHAIYRKTGNAMDGMLSAPETFKPGGGETTRDLVNRIEQALAKLPVLPCVIVIAHGGPIAAAQIITQQLPIAQIAERIPRLGEIVAMRSSN